MLAHLEPVSLVNFWIPGKYGLLLKHFHLISDIWIVTEGFLYEQI